MTVSLWVSAFCRPQFHCLPLSALVCPSIPVASCLHHMFISFSPLRSPSSRILRSALRDLHLYISGLSWVHESNSAIHKEALTVSTYRGAEVGMCAFGGDYSVSCIGYHQRELLQKQNCMPLTVSREMLVRPGAALVLPGRAAGRAPADQTLLYESRTWLLVNCANSEGDAMAVTDGKRRGPPTLPGGSIRLSCVGRAWRASPCRWAN